MDDQLMFIQRDINCLLDEDRNTRRQGLIKLTNFFTAYDQGKQIVFEKYVLKNLMRVFEDKIEKNRESALNLLQLYLVQNLQTPLEILEGIVKILTLRLGQIPFPESSEELRLSLIKIHQIIINRCPQAYMSLLPEYSNMLFKALTDQFPEMKRVTSLLCIDTSQQLGKYVGGYMLNVVKQLASNLSHQHSKVRCVSVQALSFVVLCEGAGGFLEFALPVLKQTTVDKAQDVRKASFMTIANLLQNFSVPNLTLFENSLFLALLNGLSDDHQDIQQLTMIYLQQVGEKRMLLDQELGNS